MPDFETLFSELLKNKQGLTTEELRSKIDEKRKSVGSGYLTDQGALYLVAGEMGVSLQPSASPDMAIKDVYIGANDLTLVARVLSVYPIAAYKRRKDGTDGKYRRLALFDGKQVIRLTVWDEQAEEVSKLGLEQDMAVRVVSAYVRQGLDGKPNLNLGARGRIEVLTDERKAGELATLARTTEPLVKISQDSQFVAVECLIKNEPRYSEFVRSDGTPGSLYQFVGTAPGGREETRIVIWSPSQRPDLKPGQRVVVTNLRSRRSAGGEFELHGDAGSVIVVGARRKEPVILRVASVTETPSGRRLFALGSDKKVRVVALGRGVVVPIKGDVVGVSQDSESGGVLVCDTADSVKIVKDVPVPELAGLNTKLRDVSEEGLPVMIEAIALSRGSVEEVQLRDGTGARMGELFIGDDTGEMRVVGWREQAAKVSGIEPGERLSLVGVSLKGTKTGGRSLQLSSGSVIERLRNA